MPRRSSLSGLAALAIVAGLASSGHSQTKIPVPGTDRHRVQYADSTISINDLCPVLDKGLGVRKVPYYVNGQPVGFC